MKFIHLYIFGFISLFAFRSHSLKAQSTCEIPCSRNDCGTVSYDVSPVDSIVCEGSVFRFKNNTTIQTYTGLVIRWGDGKQDTVYQLNDFFHKYDLPESLKAACQNDTILRLTVCITAFKQCNEGFSCSQKVQSFPIKIALKPKASFISSATTACVGARLSFQNNTCFSNGAFYTWRYSTFRITNIKDINLDYDLPGKYDVELTARNSCGADSIKQVINIFQKPKAEVLIDTQQLCYPAIIRLKNKEFNSSDGSWNISGDTAVWETINSFPSVDSSWIRFKRLGAIGIKLKTINGCGIDSISIPFILKATPFFKTDSEVNFCQEGLVSPQSLRFAYDSQRISTLTWNINNENPSTVQGPTFPPALFRKNGTINLRTSGQCGTFNHIIRVQVFPKDTIKLSNKEVAFCSNAAPIQLSASPSGVWSGFGISTTGLIDPTKFRNKSVSTVYFDASSPYCTLRDSVILSITDALTVALAPITPLCENEVLTPLFSVNGAFTSARWIINGGNPSLFPGLNPGNITFPTPGQYGIKLEATNSCGTIFDTTTVTVLAKPVVQSLTVTPTCLGDQTGVVLNLSNPQNERLNVSIFLSGTLIFDTIVSGNVLNWKFRPLENIGTYPIKVVVSKAAKCSVETTAALKIIPKPVLSLTRLNAFCSNVEFTPSVTATGSFETIRWSFPGGIPSAFTGANPGKIKYTLSGKYPVKVEGFSVCGASIDSLILDVIEQPEITRFTATPVCLGKESTLSAKWSNLSGNPVNVQVFQSGNLLLDTTLRGDVLHYRYIPPAVSGNFPLTLITSSTAVCKSQANVNLNIYTSPPVSILNLKSFMCLKANSLELVGNPSGGNFSGIGVSDLSQGKYALPIGNGIKDRWIYYDYTDSGGCKGKDSFFIKEVKQSPVLSFDNLLSAYCKRDIWFNFNTTPPGGLINAGSGLSVESVNKAEGLFRFKPTKSGEFTFSYLYRDDSGCNDTLNWKLTVSDRFPFDPGVDTVLYSGQKLVIGKPAVPGYSYRWFNGSTLSTLVVEDPGIYTLEVFNAKSGCSVVDTIKVSFGGVNALKDPLSQIDFLEVYPNPFREFIYLKNKSGLAPPINGKRIRIMDVYGQVIKTIDWTYSQDEWLIDLNFLPSGIYYIYGLGKTKRIVKI
jgi:PKD repeat protein